MARILTDNEKLAITWGVFNNIKSFTQIYLMTGRGHNLTPNSLQDIASKWKHEESVEQFYKECKARDAVRIDMQADRKINAAIKAGDIIKVKKSEKKNRRTDGTDEGVEDEGVNGMENGIPTDCGMHDFTQPEQFLKFANQQANLLTDEKDRREYLKIIADLLRFKESDSGKDKEIRRFYTPLLCKECPLYAKESKK